MKSFDLNPDYNNIKNTLLTNELGRNKFLFRFISLLQSIDDMNCSIALDAQWGAGKTFFVKQAKLVFDAINPYIETDKLTEELKNDCKKIINLVEGYGIKDNPQLCVYYNAWENDNDDDPILSLIYSIANNISTEIKITEGKRDLGAIIQSIVSLINVQINIPLDSTNQNSMSFGIDGQRINDVVDAFKKKKDFGTIEHEKKLKREMNEFLNSLLPEKANRLVIFIDELDRCKPLYAVKLLERIKHYYDNNNITFVFSTNLSELKNTINNLYGEQFNASKYLDKFFDITLQLPQLNIEKYFNYLGFGSNSISTLVRIRIAEVFNLGLREINRLLKNTFIANKMLRKPNQATLGNEKFYNFISDFLTPVLLALKMTNTETYESFIAGNQPEIFLSIFNMPDYANNLLDYWAMINPNEQNIKLETKFKQIYNCIFIESGRYHRRNQLGAFQIYEDSLEEILEITSLLSDYAGYDE